MFSRFGSSCYLGQSFSVGQYLRAVSESSGSSPPYTFFLFEFLDLLFHDLDSASIYEILIIEYFPIGLPL